MAELNRFLVERRCTFRDEPIPTLLKPYFISPEQDGALRYVVEKISSALNKFIALYLEDEAVRSIMNFSEQENELFSIDPGYRTPVVVARLDAFMEGESVKFLEFNCDSPAGVAYADVMEEGFKELLGNYPFLERWEIGYTDRREPLYRALIDCYTEFRADRPAYPARPTIAIVDWEEIATAAEFELLKIYFEGKGHEVVISCPRKVTVEGDHLVVGGRPIHLIYRRVIIRELLEKADEVAGFIEGVKKGLACVCNPFRSFIVGNKKVLSLLRDPRFQGIYDREELEVIAKTVPWTRVLADAEATYEGEKVGLRDFVSRKKDQLVLKAANSYGGKDVFLGNETAQDRWDEVIAAKIASEEWVVQEYVPIPRAVFPVIERSVALRPKKVNINPFALLGHYGGTITRISDHSIINVSAGGGLVPTLTASLKEPEKTGR